MKRKLLPIWFLITGALGFAQAPVSIGTFRSSTNQYFLDTKHNLTWSLAQSFSFLTYAVGDRVITGDWNGDGTTKLGVFRSGVFYLDYNGNGTWDGNGTDRQYSFATFGSTDIPVIGDWTGDGKAKVGIYRDGFWLLDLNNNGVWDGSAGDRLVAIGGSGSAYVPIVGDWNGDGRAKPGYYNAGTWALDYNGDGIFDGNDKLYTFSGSPGEIPVVGDWTGDRKTKIGTYRAGFWALDLNGNGIWDGAAIDQFTAFGGNAGEQPVTGDWNGDGRAKVGVFFGAANWWLDANGNGKWDGYAVDFASPYGAGGDVPVTGKWTAATPSLPNSLSIGGAGPVGHGAATPQTFTFTYHDIYGAGNITSGEVEFIDGANSGAARCIFQWTNTGGLHFFSTGASAGLNTTLSDNFCSVAVNSVSSPDPFSVTVSFSIGFFQNFLGNYGVETQVVDASGFQTSWGQVGTYKVDQNPIGPLSGAGGAQTFTVAAADTNDPVFGSYTNIKKVQVIFNWSPTAVDGCALQYDAANDLLYLLDATGSMNTFLPIRLISPSTTVLGDDTGSANCKVMTGSYVSFSGANLVLSLNVVFKSTFIGPQNTYVAVSDTISTAQPVQVGTWTAYPASATLPIGIPPSGINQNGTITLTYHDDANGFGYVPIVYAELGLSFDSPANCFILYERGTGALNHKVSLFGTGWGNFIDSGVVGAPGVPLESSACQIDLSRSYVGENGNAGALNLFLLVKNANAGGGVASWTFPVDRANSSAGNWWPSSFSIVPSDITISNNSGAVSVQAGQSTTYGVRVDSVGNFTGNVTVSCAVTGGLTCAGSTVAVPAGGFGTATIAVTAPSGAAAGVQTVTASATGGSVHTQTQTVTVTSVPIPPTVTLSANQTQSAAYPGYTFYTVTATGSSTWPAGKLVHISTFRTSAGIGVGPYQGTAAAGTVIADQDISVPGSVEYRIFSGVGIGTFSAVIQATDTVTTFQYATTTLTLVSTSGAVSAPSLSVVSLVTVPVGGSITTPVGLSAPASFVGSVSLSATSAAGSSTSLDATTLSVGATRYLTINAGTLQAGTSFLATVSGTNGVANRQITATVQGNGSSSSNPAISEPAPAYAYTYNDNVVSQPFNYTCVNCGLSSIVCRVNDNDSNQNQITGIATSPNPVYQGNSGGQFSLTYQAQSSVAAGSYVMRCYKSGLENQAPIPGSISFQVLPAGAKPIVTSVCNYGNTNSDCDEPVISTGSVTAITINGSNLSSNSGLIPTIRFYAPVAPGYVTAQVSNYSATTINATVTVPPDVVIGEYGVIVFPNGTDSTQNGFQGTGQKPGSNKDKKVRIVTGGHVITSLSPDNDVQGATGSITISGPFSLGSVIIIDDDITISNVTTQLGGLSATYTVRSNAAIGYHKVTLSNASGSSVAGFYVLPAVSIFQTSYSGTASPPPVGIPKSNFDSLSVNLSAVSTQEPIQLTITVASGSGSAQFDDMSTSKQVTQSGAYSIHGITESSGADNLIISAKSVNHGRVLAQLKFSVVTASITLRAQNQQFLSPFNDVAAQSYFSLTGTYELGRQFGLFSNATKICGIGVELVGAVMPLDYKGLVTIRRNIVDYKLFADATDISFTLPPPGDDSTNLLFLASDPQAGSLKGFVYNVDQPGTVPPTPDSLVTARARDNFETFAVLGDRTSAVLVSNTLNYFARVSCAQPGPFFVDDVPNDNIVSLGRTVLTWNLQ